MFDSSILTLAFIPQQFMQTNAAQLKGFTILRLSETLGEESIIIQTMNNWSILLTSRKDGGEIQITDSSYRRLLSDRQEFSIDWANAHCPRQDTEELQDLRFRKKKTRTAISIYLWIFVKGQGSSKSLSDWYIHEGCIACDIMEFEKTKLR